MDAGLTAQETRFFLCKSNIAENGTGGEREYELSGKTRASAFRPYPKHPPSDKLHLT